MIKQVSLLFLLFLSHFSWCDIVFPAADEPYVLTGGFSYGVNIIIEDGATVKLEDGLFRFGNDKGIIIENGGRLYTFDAILSTYQDRWTGILLNLTLLMIWEKFRLLLCSTLLLVKLILP